MKESTERSIRIFLASLKSEKTKEDYIRSIQKFRVFKNIDNLDEYIKKEPMKIQQDFEDYILWMRENVFTNSIPTFYYPLQAFLEMNDIMINFKKLRRLFPQKVKTSVERGWIREEIQKMLKVSDSLKIMAVIHFENASGGRLGLFENLSIKHLKEIWDDMYGKCYGIIGYADSREEYITFLTPEASKALDDYLELRKTQGEIITKESPVFKKDRNFIGIESAPCRSLGGSVMELQKKAGLRDPTKKRHGRYPVQGNHGFRHRFNEIIKSSNLINPHIAERLLSHSSKMIPLDSTYYHPTIETLWKEYKKVIPLLTIESSERLVVENKKLEHEVSELTQIHESTQNQSKEIEKLKKMVERLQKYMHQTV